MWRWKRDLFFSVHTGGRDHASCAGRGGVAGMTTEPKEANMGRKFRILCVDDEETPLVLRKFLLQKAGYEVLTARSAEEALAIASTSAVDLVLSDYLMPGTTGT